MVGSLVGSLLDVVLPAACAGCRCPGVAICEICRVRLAAEVLSFGGPQPWQPSPVPPGFGPCRTAAAYDGLVAELVRAHKDAGRHDLLPVLGALLAAPVAQLAPPTPILLVPIPSRAAAVRERGRHVTAELAREAARGRPSMRVVNALRLRRPVADQAGLDRDARRANLYGAMCVRRRALPIVAAGAPVILIDDVVTSGATLAEARRALTAAGADVLGSAVLCARRRGAHLSTR